MKLSGRVKFAFILMGVDLGLALVCAFIHDIRILLFLGLAFLQNWIGDMQYEKDQTKGDNDNG